jgi:hypothetical protein
MVVMMKIEKKQIKTSPLVVVLISIMLLITVSCASYLIILFGLNIVLQEGQYYEEVVEALSLMFGFAVVLLSLIGIVWILNSVNKVIKEETK